MRCVRKNPGGKAYIDEIKIQEDNIYLFENEKYVLWDSNVYSLKHIELKNNIFILSYDFERDIDYYSPDRDKVIVFEPNIKIKEEILDGIVIAIKKVGDKYLELSLDEADEVINILNEV